MNVFITGASSGIGAALAQVYALEGATVGLIARRMERLEEIRQQLPPARGASHFIAAVDVTDAAALAAAAQQFMLHAGPPDVIIASAGISGGTRIGMAGDLAVIDQIMATNVGATAATFAPFIEPMRGRPGARLVAIASVAGIRGLPGSSAYSASKAAVIALVEGLRVELRDSAIRVVTIAPGFIATPMTEHNPYPMPFLMPVERFAMAAKRAIDAGVSYRVIPWQMGLVAKLLRVMPNPLYDLAFARATHKPRINR